MPHVDFEVVTRSAVGPQWRSASAEQRSRLQAEFKQLLIRVYAGALTELRDQSVQITRTQPVQGSTQVIVQSEVRGKGEPVKLDYRLDKRGAAGAESWKIIDVNVAGLWLVQNYRTQFAQELTKGGIDGLIAALVERNKGGKS
jgi:phospholipid transport system substrate-binding protein